jgi:GxxExxY protein|tara:strand:- start:47 stop:478 length:432 start_codon:yes stop_codon:yes gene_type:complete
MSDKLMTKGWVHKICRKIYNELGPYHTEMVYQNAMEYELKRKGFNYQREKQVPINYDGIVIGQGKIDFYVEPNYVLEFKAIASNLYTKEGEINQNIYIRKHHHQVQKYLQSLNIERGYLINFNTGAKAELEILEIVNPLLGDE